MEFLGQGSDLRHSWRCGNAIPLTHCARPGIKPSSQCSRDATKPVLPQKELQKSSVDIKSPRGWWFLPVTREVAMATCNTQSGQDSSVSWLWSAIAISYYIDYLQLILSTHVTDSNILPLPSSKKLLPRLRNTTPCSALVPTVGWRDCQNSCPPGTSQSDLISKQDLCSCNYLCWDEVIKIRVGPKYGDGWTL